MPEQDANEADYRHGSELIAQAFRDFLLKQLVDFRFESNRVYMTVGSTKVTFLTQPEWVPPELKKALESQGARLITRVSDISSDD